MEKKNTKKKNVKKATKKVTEKKIVEKKVATKKKKTISDYKDLIFSLLYFACSIVWVICGVDRAILKEKFVFDIIVSIFLFIVAVIYYMNYKKAQK